MSFIAGDILIRMAADVASLRKDMDSAKGVVEQATMVMKTAAIGLAGAFSASMFAGWIRSAIDAGDEMNKLAQRTGIATEDIAGLQLAFRLSGAESGAFGSAMAKLSKQITDGNDAFQYLGIAVRNADGSVRNAKDVLYEVADAFKESADGAGKSALAMEIFGKSGAELIPLLNTGSEGLRQMDEMARKLGLTMSDESAKAAEEFNDTLDLISLSGQGVARQIAGEILPTLKSLAGTFLENITAGDGLSKVAAGLAAALKLLFSAGTIGVEVFSTLGKAVGALGGAIVSILQGEFRQAAQIGKEFASDIRTDWSNTATTLEKVWTGAGGQTVDSMVKMQGALRQLTPATKEQTEAAKKAAEAAKKHAEELDKAAEALKLESAGLSADYLRKLKQLVELRDTGRISTEEYIKAVEDLINKQPAIKKALEDELKLTQAVAQHKTKLEQATIAETEALRKSNIQIIEQNARLQLSERELIDREKAVLRNQAADLEWQAAMEGGNYQLEEQARLLRQRADLLEQGVALKEAKAAREEWEKTTKAIEDGLTEALMRGFEGGKGFVENLIDTIKNSFKTLVANFIIRPIMAPIAGAIGGMFGMSGANAGGIPGIGGGNIFSGIGSFLNGSLINNSLGNMAAFGADSIGSWLVNNTSGPLNSIGGSLMGNAGTIGNIAGMAGNAFAGYGISKAISGGYTTGGNTVNALAAIASAFVGPIAGVIGGLINRAFGRKLADQGIEGTFGGGDFSGNNYAFYKGGWFRSDKTKRSPMDKELEDALGAGAAAIFNKTKAYAEILKLPAEQLDLVTSTMKISLTNDAAKNEQLIAEAMQKYGDTLAATFAPILAPFEKAGESVAETLARLAAMQVFAEQINEFGGIFSKIASSSYEAQDALITLAGGMEALGQLANDFISLYYTDAEKMGIQAREVFDRLLQYFTEEELAAAGISRDDTITREEFRALVESREVDTELGREQLIALLSLSKDFAMIADYMKENNVTLQDLIDSAPQVEAIEGLIDPQQATAENTLNMSNLQTEANGFLGRILNRIEAIDVSASASVIAAQAAAQAAAAAASAAQAAADTSALTASQPNYAYDIGGGA